jgi:NADH-quinone oxidoreductase subunit L
MRKMGGLAKYMPITAVTCWIGALALVGTPFFSGFYSKDAIIEAVGESHRFGSRYAYWCVLSGVFVTALYTFRLLFMTFHGPERWRGPQGHPPHEAHPLPTEQGAASHHEPDVSHAADHLPHESPAVVTVPLIALAIPSLVIGALTVAPVLFGGYFGHSIFVLPPNDVTARVGADFAGPVAFALHGLISPPFLLALAGAITAWAFFLKRPQWADAAAARWRWLYTTLTQKYYFDWFNDNVLVPLARLIGTGLWKGGDQALIDGVMVNGTARELGWLGGLLRRAQSGYLYSYAFWMMIGLALLLGWFLTRG